jgi:hypothetical protein
VTYSSTKAGLEDKLEKSALRMIDLETYVLNGKRRFAAVFVENTGLAQKEWDWFYDLTGDEVKSRHRALGARLVDIDSYRKGSSLRYAGVTIKNTGVDRTDWWWYRNAARVTINSKLREHNARLIDIDPSVAGRFNAIMVSNRGSDRRFSIWVNQFESADQIRAFVRQNGTRIFDVESVVEDGERRYTVVAIDNANALTRQLRLSWLPINRFGAPWGFYLKHIGGTVRAGINEDKVFDPASTIKVLYNAHVMHLVSEGKTSLDDTIPWYYNPNDTTPYPPPGRRPSDPERAAAWERQWASYGSTQHGCSDPVNGTKRFDTQRLLLDLTLKYSDNRTTHAFFLHYGKAPLNQTAQELGMSSTVLNRGFGCGDSGAYNRLTLADLGRLYERVQTDTSYFAGWTRALFYARMAQAKWLWKDVIFH